MNFWTAFGLTLILGAGSVITVLIYLAISDCQVIDGDSVLSRIYNIEGEDCKSQRLTGAFAAGASAALTLVLAITFWRVLEDDK